MQKQLHKQLISQEKLPQNMQSKHTSYSNNITGNWGTAYKISQDAIIDQANTIQYS